ncbi:molybdate ABC transporter substrate-binding protein [Phaeobacter porticola]|nr:molybdate ABC transporter substrate-binding protein [Phaeobacter porticola]
MSYESLRRAWHVALLIVTLSFSLPCSAPAEQLTVFAAASLKTALEQITDVYETNSGNDVVLSLAGSSLLARQLQHGAPADVFISANTAWMDWAQDQNLINSETRTDLLGNTLVLIGPPTMPLPAAALTLHDGAGLLDLVQDRPLAMALVDAVPAGIYGKAALQKLGLWDRLESHVAQTDNVRTALVLVTQGAAGLGVVYGSDVTGGPNVTQLAEFPSDSYPPIIYPAAATNSRPEATAFLAFLRSPIAKEIFVRQGFVVLAE